MIWGILLVLAGVLVILFVPFMEGSPHVLMDDQPRRRDDET